MTKLLLSIHVLAAILVVGPITVAASLFPRYARQSAAGGEEPDDRAAGIAALLHRICRGYAIAGVAVPVFGIATGAQLGVLTDAWLIASLALTAIAAAVLVLAILPSQQRLLAPPTPPPPHPAGHDGRPPTVTRLTMLTGMFNLLWAIVVVLMIVRPGSTTGA
ncbi:hypothetical protein [Streptomyces flavidovirens]|uniref:hypothetical protein n=1 Tax=Streptomyces flavidovirens TaxID=67298 RepID=UPI00040C2E17|nr:hypothetical protein [Streptomyces flavidovirens]